MAIKVVVIEVVNALVFQIHVHLLRLLRQAHPLRKICDFMVRGGGRSEQWTFTPQNSGLSHLRTVDF